MARNASNWRIVTRVRGMRWILKKNLRIVKNRLIVRRAPAADTHAGRRSPANLLGLDLRFALPSAAAPAVIRAHGCYNRPFEAVFKDPPCSTTFPPIRATRF